jgi:dCTP deaminase
MILSNIQICAARSSERIIIEPYNLLNVNTSSYDVTLGEWFWRASNPEETYGGMGIYNPWSERNVNRVWNRKRVAEPAAGWKHHFKTTFDWTGINDDDRLIVIQPGELILAHTQEFIGGVKNITTMMKARSSMGRNFIRVCSCSGWGDVGYTNRWTMEIENVSKYAIPLVVGRRIAQIVFLETGDTYDRNYVHDDGKYQSSVDVDELMRNWVPEDMIPKLYMDRDIK